MFDSEPNWSVNWVPLGEYNERADGEACNFLRTIPNLPARPTQPLVDRFIALIFGWQDVKKRIMLKPVCVVVLCALLSLSAS
jgi:hypothetical protein